MSPHVPPYLPISPHPQRGPALVRALCSEAYPYPYSEAYPYP